MNAREVVDSIKQHVGETRGKVVMAAAHGQDVIHTGGETLRAARQIVVTASREAASLVIRTRDDLVVTLKQGASQVADKLSRLTTPTRKEVAMARKAQVKEKKKRKRAEAARDPAPDSAGDGRTPQPV